MSADRTDETSDSRGRASASPTQIPAKGWLDVLLRVKNNIGTDTLSLVAAGVSFYAFLAIFPAITALLAIYGLVADPSDVARQVGALQGTVPSSALQIIQKQMSSIAQGDDSSLSIGLAVSLLLAIYSASKGTGALIMALNIAYDEDEKRGFIKLKCITMLLTLAAIVFVLFLVAVIGLAGYLAHADLPLWLVVAIRAGRWAVVLVLMMAVIAGCYALAPSRDRPKLRWVTPGAIVATVVWLIVSIAFSFYISNFSSYNKTYGSAAAIVILMLWFWMSAFVILIGAEINAELEGQTRKDTTRGRPEARGKRDAVVADEVR